MNTKIKYTDESLGEIKIIRDFLPSPAELAFSEESVKVTISLSKKSDEFFKTEASKYHTQYHTQYQRMIRQILDSYADVQTEQRTTHSTARTRKLRAD